MRLQACILVVLMLLVAACDSAPPGNIQRQARTAAATPVAASGIPHGQLPDHVAPLHYRLDLTMNPDQLRYEGTVEIEIELKAPKREFYIHGKDLDVSKVAARLSNRTTVAGTYAQVDPSGIARLSFDQQIPAGKINVLIPFSAAFETSPDALTAMSDGGMRYVWSQFEEISARRAFPCFDEPRFKTPFDVSITTLERDAVISNTLPVSQEKVSDGVVRTTFATTAPLPTYLLALAVGPYDVISAPPAPASKIRAEPLPLRAVTVNGKGERARIALAATVPLLDTLENYFAAPFPYPKLDLIAPPNFPAGGMENAGAITYTERGILLAPGAPASQRRYFELLHAHEMSHQWFGDLVTPPWWNDIWLNEAFASWAGNRSAAETWPADELDRETIRDALDVMDRDALASARSIRQPIVTNDDIFNSFDGLTYNKGAAVLQMFEAWLGADVFRDGVRLYMRRFAHGSAGTDDFLSALAEASRKPDTTQAINTFLNQPGVPLVLVETSCTKRDLDVRITQSPYGASTAHDTRTWLVPVCMRELGRSRPLPCTLVSDKPATFTVRNLCGTPLMPNMNAAGYYRFTMGQQEWRKLAASMKSMPPSEQLATLHSLRAALRAGDADVKTFVGALRGAAGSNHWDVVELATTFLLEAHDNLVPAANRDEARRAIAKWLPAPMAKTGNTARPGERVATTLLRSSLANWTVRLTRDPQALAMFSAQGAAAVKALTAPQPGKFQFDDLTPVSLWAFVHAGGEPAARDTIAALTATRDAEIRNALIRALPAARDPAATKAISAFILAGQLRARETFTWLREAFADADMRTATWAWLRENDARLVEITGASSQARLIDLPARLCEPGADTEVEKYYAARVAKIDGAPRKLANTLETIRNCLSWKSTRGGQIVDALKATDASGHMKGTETLMEVPATVSPTK